MLKLPNSSTDPGQTAKAPVNKQRHVCGASELGCRLKPSCLLVLSGAGGLPIWKSHDFERRGKRGAWFLNLVVCFGWFKEFRQHKVFSSACYKVGTGVLAFSVQSGVTEVS